MRMRKTREGALSPLPEIRCRNFRYGIPCIEGCPCGD